MADKKAKINMRPIGGRVIVKPLEEEEKTAGGLIIPATVNKEKPQQGTIIALGKKVNDEGKELPFNVKVGDTIIFKKYAPDEIELDGENYLIVDESDILAVIA